MPEEKTVGELEILENLKQIRENQVIRRAGFREQQSSLSARFGPQTGTPEVVIEALPEWDEIDYLLSIAAVIFPLSATLFSCNVPSAAARRKSSTSPSRLRKKRRARNAKRK